LGNDDGVSLARTSGPNRIVSLQRAGSPVLLTPRAEGASFLAIFARSGWATARRYPSNCPASGFLFSL